MRKKRSTARPRAVCQEVRFVEVEFPAPIRPRLVVSFSDGLHLLLEDEGAARVAAEFIAAYRAAEGKGGRR
jgi:hypothetical protein